MSTNENEFGNTFCPICYDDLKPLSTEFLQTISICGHVFHELCLQQWFEYCNVSNIACPLCKQKCCDKDLIRLYFQSNGEKGTLEDEIKKLKDKLSERNYVMAQQQRKLKILSKELKKSNDTKEELKKFLAEKYKADLVCYKALLKLRTEDLVKAESECSRLQQDCLGYRGKLAALEAELEIPTLQQDRSGYSKKLAAVKSALVINLDDEEDNLGSIGNTGNTDKSKDTVGTPKNLRCNSRQPQTPKAGSGSGGGKAQSFTKRTYLKAVEDKLQDDKEKYYEIIKVVKDIEDNKIEVEDARSRVQDLLECHQELVLGFNNIIARNFGFNNNIRPNFEAKLQGRRKARSFTKRTYLKALEDKFQNNKEKYYEIIKVMKDIEANKINIADAKSRVDNILEGYQEFVSGFSSVIARNSKTPLQCNHRVLKLILDIERMYQRKSISKSEFYYETAVLLRHHPDLLDDFKQFYQEDVMLRVERNSRFWSMKMMKHKTEMLYF